VSVSVWAWVNPVPQALIAGVGFGSRTSTRDP
jgi:hypothetical protein